MVQPSVRLVVAIAAAACLSAMANAVEETAHKRGIKGRARRGLIGPLDLVQKASDGSLLISTKHASKSVKCKVTVKGGIKSGKAEGKAEKPGQIRRHIATASSSTQEVLYVNGESAGDGSKSAKGKGSRSVKGSKDSLDSEEGVAELAASSAPSVQILECTEDELKDYVIDVTQLGNVDGEGDGETATTTTSTTTAEETTKKPTKSSNSTVQVTRPPSGTGSSTGGSSTGTKGESSSETASTTSAQTEVDEAAAALSELCKEVQSGNGPTSGEKMTFSIDMTMLLSITPSSVSVSLQELLQDQVGTDLVGCYILDGTAYALSASASKGSVSTDASASKGSSNKSTEASYTASDGVVTKGSTTSGLANSDGSSGSKNGSKSDSAGSSSSGKSSTNSKSSVSLGTDTDISNVVFAVKTSGTTCKYLHALNQHLSMLLAFVSFSGLVTHLVLIVVIIVSKRMRCRCKRLADMHRL
jgi:ElaB/YqjD/DUF883 family membrane-anchored ribosome-binding protein